MIGKHRIIVQNKRVKYDFEVRRNITIIRGDSATGKTSLIEMIREYNELEEDSGVELQCDKNCVALSGINWKIQLEAISDSIVFIDEGNAFVMSKEFATMVQDSDNYYVLVTRQSIPTLPYSVNEIYGIRVSGKYASLKQRYNEFYHIYGESSLDRQFEPQIVLTEDSNSGKQFFDDVCNKNILVCESANGKSNIFWKLTRYKEESVLVIADGAAFGSEIDKILKLIEGKNNIELFLPESFEWLILQSDIINNKELKVILQNTYDYVESKDYLSWERYFTNLLIELTQDTYLKYNKSVLNEAYLQDKVQKKIIDEINIDFEWKKDRNNKCEEE